MRGRPFIATACLMVLAAVVVAQAQVNMPDPSMIAGRALPAPELPDGTVSVRVVREAIGNNVVGQEVSVTAGGASKTGKTDENGRAQVTGLTAGAQGTATATVAGEALVSEPFEVPARGGIRIILISGMRQAAERKAKEEAAAAAVPAVKGTVVFGGDSRIMMEFKDDELRVFYLLDIINTARTRVDIGGPLTIELPREAQGATVLDGSTPNATARGNQVVVAGPFAAGTTPLQIAFGLPHDGSTLTITQKWPAATQQVLVMVQKVGSLQMTSAQFTEHDEARAQNGTPYILGGGLGLPAGGALTVQLSGLPAHPKWPKQLALTLAGAIFLAGAWFASSRGTSDAAADRRMADRRESLLGDLVKLEEQRRGGRVDGARYASKRQRLVAELERIYGEMDGTPAGRTGGGEVAA